MKKLMNNILLSESEWNFHFGNGHDFRPYVSDNKYRMGGRETGHFGSGTYFSTYKGIKDVEGYGDLSRNMNPNFIQVGEHVYRVDFDLYKNLYRVRSKKQGDILYTMLANLNHMFNRISYLGQFHAKSAYYNNSGLYQEIKANADGLGLKCPSYYELTRMAQRLGSDKNDIRSFSTVFMEYNGYNGVNVSGIEFYDNTKHGSVIYDLSKVNSDMEEISPKNMYTGYKDSSYDHSVVRGFSDPRMDALNGDYITWYDKLNSIPLTDAMRLLKNYLESGHILSYFNIKDLKDDLIKRYLRLIFVRNPKGYFGDSIIDDEIITGNESKYYIRLIDEYGAYYWVNYESKNRYNSILINLLSNFSMNLDWNLSAEQERMEKEKYLNILMGYMNRDLSKWEKEYIEEDYYD